MSTRLLTTVLKRCAFSHSWTWRHTLLFLLACCLQAASGAWSRPSSDSSMGLWGGPDGNRVMMTSRGRITTGIIEPLVFPSNLSSYGMAWLGICTGRLRGGGTARTCWYNASSTLGLPLYGRVTDSRERCTKTQRILFWAMSTVPSVGRI